MKDIFTNVSWFDLIVVVFIAIGLIRGKRRGMSQELLDFLMWVGIVVLGALGYKFIASVIVQKTGLELLWAQVLGYFAIVLVCLIVKSMLERFIQDSIIEWNLFGGLEYILGMFAGAIRFLCMLLMVLALLNAKLITDQERQEEIKKQEKELGSVFFPSLGQIQHSVFNESLSGRFVKKQLSWVLIEGVASSTGAKEKEPASIKSKKQETIDKIIGK